MATLADVVSSLPGSEVELHSGASIRRFLVKDAYRNGRELVIVPRTAAKRPRDGSGSWSTDEPEQIEVSPKGQISVVGKEKLRVPLRNGHFDLIPEAESLNWQSF